MCASVAVVMGWKGGEGVASSSSPWQDKGSRCCLRKPRASLTAASFSLPFSLPHSHLHISLFVMLRTAHTRCFSSSSVARLASDASVAATANASSSSTGGAASRELPLPKPASSNDAARRSDGNKHAQASSRQSNQTNTNDRGGQDGQRRQRNLSPSVLRTQTPRVVRSSAPRAAPQPQTDWNSASAQRKSYVYAPPGVPRPVPSPALGADGKPLSARPLRVAERALRLHLRPGASSVVGPIESEPVLSAAEESEARITALKARIGGETQAWSSEALLKKGEQRKDPLSIAADELSRNADIAPSGRKAILDKIRELAS